MTSSLQQEPYRQPDTGASPRTTSLQSPAASFQAAIQVHPYAPLVLCIGRDIQCVQCWPQLRMNVCRGKPFGKCLALQSSIYLSLACSSRLWMQQDTPQSSPLGPHTSPLRSARSGSMNASPVLEHLRAAMRPSPALQSPAAMPESRGDSNLPPRVPALNLAAKRFGSSPATASAPSTTAEHASVRLQLLSREGDPQGRLLAASIVPT